MKMNDIEKRFTEITSEYIAKGFTFSQTMSGHQGEIMKVDLTDGNKIIRVRLDRLSEHSDDYMYNYYGVELIVESFEMPKYIDTFTTPWNGRGTEIFRAAYYSFSGRDRDENTFYTADKDEIKAAQDKHYARHEAKRVSDKELNNDAAKKIVLSWLNRQPKCKSKRLSDINRIVKRNSGVYAIYLNNNDYHILRAQK